MSEKKEMTGLNVVIAGAAGEGVQTIGAVLGDTLQALGYAPFCWQEFESRIRGGQNSYSIRIREEPLNAPLMEADILLALNKGAAEKYGPRLKSEGILLGQERTQEKMIAVPFVRMAKDESGDAIYANTIAVGALSALLDIDLQTLTRVLAERFAGKGDKIVEANREAAEKGYLAARRDCKGMCPWTLPKVEGDFHLISCNEAIPLAAAYAGCRLISAYPMSPSTEIITFLASQEEKLGIFTEQAEDEIAAINMAIGASYAGARAMTATSGGGFALMAEAVSLAGMTETPLVIILAQRPGPATGLPTRTAQGDLLFSIHAGHGEFPKVVLAPSDPRAAFYLTVRAFNLADKYQTPVVVLTDQFLSDSRFSIGDFDLKECEPVSYLSDPSTIEDYKRYRLTRSGISPRLYPGQSRHLVGADSDEHDEGGHITEDLTGTALPMYRKRLAKLKGLREEIRSPETSGIEEAETILVSWGSSRNAVLEAIELLRKDDVRAGMIHFTEVWPLPNYDFPEGKRLITVEGNATGQLGRLLRSEFGITFSGHLGRCDGLPLSGAYIRSAFHDNLERLSK